MVLLARNDPKPWQVTAQKTSLAFVLAALGGGRKTDGETVWETGRIPGERDRSGPGPRRGSGGSDGSATAQLDNHLLAVIAGTAVTHLLQGAGSFSQQHCPLARRR